MMMLPIGTTLGPYRIVDELGNGTGGEVYLAEDIRVQDREVAIKVMQTAKADFPSNTVLKKAVNTFQHEAQMISKLGHHPNILPLYDYGEQEQPDGNSIYTYLVMPYEKKGSLANWIEERSINSSNVLSPIQANDIVCMAADALQYAHNQGVIHRDVKPSNFLIGIGNTTTKLGSPDSPYILLSDFGSAKLSQGLVKTRVIGTPYFMAPEQWQGTCVPATDQYALAIMTFFLLTGEYPFDGTDFPELMNKHITMQPPRPSAIHPQLPEQIDDVILHALAKDPDKRYPSVTEFAQAFSKAAVLPASPVVHPIGKNKNLVKKAFQQIGLTKGKSGPHAVQKPPLRFIIFILLIVLILLATSSGTILYVQQRNMRFSNATATASTLKNTAIAENNLTATARASATAIAHATTTAIAGATATAIAQNYPFAPLSNRVINEQFAHDNFVKSNPYGWETQTGANTDCTLISGGYILTDKGSNTPTTCFAGGTSFSNFTYQANFQITQGDCGGILFRANDNNANYYLFYVCTDGTYAIYYYANNQKNLISNGPSKNIVTALHHINVIGVVARGNSLEFFANNPNQAIYLTSDNSYTGSGKIGVVAIDDNKPTTVVFLVAEVYQL